MQAQFTDVQCPQSSGHALMGIGIAVLFGGALQQGTAFLGHFLCSVAGQLLQVLPCLFLTVCRFLDAHVIDLQRLFECYWLLGSIFPVIHCILGIN